jgi:hypothetical protein
LQRLVPVEFSSQKEIKTAQPALSVTNDTIYIELKRSLCYETTAAMFRCRKDVVWAGKIVLVKFAAQGGGPHVQAVHAGRLLCCILRDSGAAPRDGAILAEQADKAGRSVSARRQHGRDGAPGG